MKKIVLLFTVLIVGCCHLKTVNGDLQVFVVKKLKEYGAVVYQQKEKKLPNDVSWRYSEDENGFIITVDGDYYKAVDGFFKAMYGEPYMETKGDGNRSYSAVYNAATAGMAIQYSLEDGSYTTINAIKPRKD